MFDTSLRVLGWLTIGALVLLSLIQGIALRRLPSANPHTIWTRDLGHVCLYESAGAVWGLVKIDVGLLPEAPCP